MLLNTDVKDLDQVTAELLTKYKELSERHNAVLEHNQVLQHECNDLQDIVKSYEENLQVITGKLRSHTASTSHQASSIQDTDGFNRYLLLKGMSS